MAHLLRRPPGLSLHTSAPISLSVSLQARTFSHAVPRLGPPRHMQAQQPRPPSERSIRIASKEMGMTASDLGLLPDTFIAPSGANAPSLFTSPLAALSLQWTRLKRKTSDLLVVSIYRWTNHKCGVKIHFRQTAPTAKALHQAMYTAFAAGDLATLKRITADGLFDSFSARVHARPRGERWVWELVRYTRRPRVMSNRAASLMVDDAGIRQAVVRICSRQRLTRYKADGSVVKGSGEEREVKEYVVIQRKLWKGKEGEWVVWGTTEETTQEMVEEAKKKALQ